MQDSTARMSKESIRTRIREEMGRRGINEVDVSNESGLTVLTLNSFLSPALNRLGKIPSRASNEKELVPTLTNWLRESADQPSRIPIPLAISSNGHHVPTSDVPVSISQGSPSAPATAVVMVPRGQRSLIIIVRLESDDNA